MNLHRIMLVVAVTSALSAPAAGAEPIVTSDLLRLRSVSSIEMARDGSRAVIAVRSIMASEPDAETPGFHNASHLFLLEVQEAGAPMRQLTFGERRDSRPRLSPDGRRVAFLRRRGEGEDASTQVWILPLEGGEARPVTGLTGGVRDVVWSPDGLTLLVTSSAGADELAGTPPWPVDAAYEANDPDVIPRPDGTREEIRRWLADNARGEDPTVIRRLSFQGEQSLEGPMTMSQLYIVDPDDQPTRPLRITTGHKSHDHAVFLPGGRGIIYSAKRQTGAHPDEVDARSLWRIDVDGGNDREVLDIDGWALARPSPSLDGSVIAFRARPLDEPAFRGTRLAVAPVTGPDLGEAIWLTDEQSLDASVWSFAWMHARSSLVFNIARRGGIPLMTMGLGLLEPAELIAEAEGEPIGVGVYGVGGGAVVYSATSAANPCVLRIRDARGDRVVADLNPWIAEKELAKPVEGWITRPDGERVQYWLMEPTRRRIGATYPLVLEIHGGPSSMWGPGEATMWHEFQLLCSWGYGVVFANPRGSGGYGYEFQKGNQQNWGDGPAGDVLAVVDQVLLEDWVDADRLVVTGGSYGGYLTAWIVAHDHRFKSAVAQRGVYDLTTFYGEGNAWRLVEWSMGGPPWEARTRAVLQRESPLTSVNRIRTPLLIMHASDDLRTGVSQSEMLFRSLRRLGRPVEYVRYPGAGHDLSRTGDPGQRMDRLNRMIDWFERFVDNPRPAPVVNRGWNGSPVSAPRAPEVLSAP